MNNNDNNIELLFFGGYKNILSSMLTILPSSSIRAILLTSRTIYSCIPLKAIQYYSNVLLEHKYIYSYRNGKISTRLTMKSSFLDWFLDRNAFDKTVGLFSADKHNQKPLTTFLHQQTLTLPNSNGYLSSKKM